MKCPKCGGNRFYASQYIEKIETVIVDENGEFLETTREFHHPDEDDCCGSQSPDGPYFCVKCGEKVDND